MNPHYTPDPGSGFGPQGPQPPQSPQPPQPPQGRYGAGMLAVLAVIAILGGASFLGGGIALGAMVTDRIAAERGFDPVEPSDDSSGNPSESPSPSPSPTPTEELSPTPTEAPIDEPENLITAEELIIELRRDHPIDSRTDTTEEFCVSDDEEEELSLFQCTSAMDTNLVRAVAFESAGIAALAAMGMEENEDSDAQDMREACHFVLVWFEQNGLDQGERDDMAGDVEDIVGCP